jgi:hypothetical protein
MTCDFRKFVSMYANSSALDLHLFLEQAHPMLLGARLFPLCELA